MPNRKVTIPDLFEMKKNKEKFSMLTAYDYPTALIIDKAKIDVILVGDSVAMVVMGHKNTLPVTMDEMIHHTKAVTRAVERAFVIGDMPFMSYNTSYEKAIENAGRFLKEGGADAVKLEGGVQVKDTVEAIVKAGIPVMAHIGLTPQTASQLGGFKVQGKDAIAAQKIIEDAKALEDAGAFSVLLECVPAPIARIVTETLSVPTVGIGAGSFCDGQVLVTHDLLGLFDRFTPKFVKRYAEIGKIMQEAFVAFREEVKKGIFPAEEHSFMMKEEELFKIKNFDKE